MCSGCRFGGIAIADRGEYPAARPVKLNARPAFPCMRASAIWHKWARKDPGGDFHQFSVMFTSTTWQNFQPYRLFNHVADKLLMVMTASCLSPIGSRTNCSPWLPGTSINALILTPADPSSSDSERFQLLPGHRRHNAVKATEMPRMPSREFIRLLRPHFAFRAKSSTSAPRAGPTFRAPQTQWYGVAYDYGGAPER